MTSFSRAYIPESELEITIDSLIKRWEANDATVRALFPQATDANYREEIAACVKREHEAANEEVWVNDTYQVAIRKNEMLAHLSIKRIDRETIHDWRELQAIKSALVGAECEGVELYPAESRVVDTANQYHLWVAIDPAYRFPFGFNGGRIVDDKPVGKSVNRKIQV